MFVIFFLGGQGRPRDGLHRITGCFFRFLSTHQDKFTRFVSSLNRLEVTKHGLVHCMQ